MAMLRNRHDNCVPLMTTHESYPVAARVILETLRSHGIAMMLIEPPWWAAFPTQILQTFGRGAFVGYVADQSAYFRSGEFEAVLYPNALLLRGPSSVAARAHALAVEALTGHPDMFQTASSQAQEIERQIQRVWSAYRLNPLGAREHAAAPVPIQGNRRRGRPTPPVLRRLARGLPTGAPAGPRPRRRAADPRGDAAEGELHGIREIQRAHRFSDAVALDAPAADAADRDRHAPGAKRGRAGPRGDPRRREGRAEHGDPARRRRGSRRVRREHAARRGGVRAHRVDARLAGGARGGGAPARDRRRDRAGGMAATRERAARGHAKGHEGGRAMGQGTSRVVEGNGTTGRVRELGDEITDVRRRLDELVMELDRRR